MPTSNNYHWSTRSMLGSGAVGDVFVGYHLKTGDSVAIKVMKKFPQKQLVHLLQLQDREMEILRRLDHPNIVKLIDVEPEPDQDTDHYLGKQIIITELCTGGSLYSLLTSPGNIFGFEDKEFLKVLEGIALGMEKLHMENIVHRDIKPGNIMRYIGDDGRTTYKLIDFGAARELHEEQEFDSIHGTAEYLHPGVYQKAFIDSNSEQSFKQSVELWSIGATLYHVAAGELPFKSFIGRKDEKTMYDIIANKKSGDISGVQKTSNGEITYGRHLPSNCVMSRGLRSLVEDLLANLLENQENKMMSFEEFFKIAKNIVNKNVVSVFDSNTTNILKIYVDSSCIFQEFQELLKDQSGINPDNQMLLYENLDFVEQFGGDRKVMTCGEVVDSNPVYLFHGPSPSIKIEDIKYSIPSDSRNASKFSTCCCESLHYIKRNVAKCLLRQKLINSGVIMLTRFLSRKYEKICMSLDNLSEGNRLNQLSIGNFELSNSFERLTSHGEVAKTAKNSLVKQRDLCSEINMGVRLLHDASINLEAGLQSTVNLWLREKPMCTEDDCCLNKIDVAVKNVTKIQEGFLNSKCDALHSKFKCQKLEKYCHSAKSLIEDHCQVNSRMMVERFHEFFRNIWSQKESMDSLEKSLTFQRQRHSQLFVIMDSSSKTLKQSLLPSNMDNKKMSSNEEGVGFISRKVVNIESQLLSKNLFGDNIKTPSRLPLLIGENNKRFEDLENLIRRNTHNSSKVGADEKLKEVGTQGNILSTRSANKEAAKNDSPKVA